MPDSTAEAVLQGPASWNSWDRKFRALAMAGGIWDLIDPNQPAVPFLTEPEMPEESEADSATEEEERSVSTAGSRRLLRSQRAGPRGRGAARAGRRYRGPNARRDHPSRLASQHELGLGEPALIGVEVGQVVDCTERRRVV